MIQITLNKKEDTCYLKFILKGRVFNINGINILHPD